MPAKKAAAPVPLPEFTSDRLRLLGPLITPRALELARSRLLNDRERLVDENMKSTTGDDLGTVRIALILLREMNPAADLTHPEEGLMRGMDRKAFGRMVRAGDL